MQLPSQMGSVLSSHSQNFPILFMGLFVMAIAPTSHWNFLTTLAFLECFYMVLINKKQVLKESEDFFFHPYYLRVKF